MEEKEYRQLVDVAFKAIGKAFDNVDPDIAEYESAQGAVTISFADGSKLILSQQPSVRQIWIAAASKGIAVHFNYDTSSKVWRDDKAQGIELKAFVAKVVRDASGAELEW